MGSGTNGEEGTGPSTERPLVGRLIRPGQAPIRGRLIRRPTTPVGTLASRGLSAARRSPWLFAALAGTALLSRLGVLLAVLSGVAAVERNDLGEILAAVGLGTVTSLVSSVLEFAIWAGGIPLLAEKMGAAPLSDPAREESSMLTRFAEGLSHLFASALHLGLLQVGAFAFFQLVGSVLAGLAIFFVVADPSSLVFLLPALLCYFVADVLWRVLSWIALARIGALREKTLPAILGGLRQFLRRPWPHLVVWWLTTLGISLVGGGSSTALATLPMILGAAPPAWLAFAVLSALGFGAVSLSSMGVFASLAIDHAGGAPDERAASIRNPAAS